MRKSVWMLSTCMFAMSALATPAYAQLHKRLLLTQQRLDPEQIEARIRHETARYAQLVATYGPAKIE